MSATAPALRRRRWPLLLAIVVVAAGTFGVAALLTNVFQKKQEETRPFVLLRAVGEDDTDPAVWAVNWPKQYDTYRLTATATRTRFGGHGGSEALPAQKAERDPWLTRLFAGYAFALDYRDRRGHAYMLFDQEATKRQTVPQSGSCLHCHAAVMPLYRELGNGDVFAGCDRTATMTYEETSARLHASGHGHPVTCVDCHEPNTMRLRVTRPAFLRGIAALAASDAAVPHLPSVQEWRGGSRARPYDPNADARRGEMRSFVCGQCHVEYTCGTKMPLTFPWGRGLRVEQIEATWDATTFPDGQPFFDFVHAETGAPVLKAQHPEFELWSQGIHARSGVSCADCHMPYMRDGATKVSDHWVRSPLLNVQRSCQVCHHFPEEELKARVDAIQQRNSDLMERAAAAMMDLLDEVKRAKAAGATAEQLRPAHALQRKAQWRIDFVAAENSMGFHAPQEAARVLGEAADFARQGQVAALRWASAGKPP
jgi:nitrite reductase (cytochrome c-552)